MRGKYLDKYKSTWIHTSIENWDCATAAIPAVKV